MAIIIIAIASANTMAQTVTANVIGSGATNAENALLQLNGTVGQAVIGNTMNAANTNAQGFWHGNSQTSNVAQPAATIADFSQPELPQSVWRYDDDKFHCAACGNGDS